MSNKPGGAGGRSRAIALAVPLCRVCGGREVVGAQFLLPGTEGYRVAPCPHCQAPNIPISTYFSKGRA